jgi:hypothetical protein
MGGTVTLATLLKTLAPEIKSGEYVFCSVAGNYQDFADLNPIAFFREQEGLTLIIGVEAAKKANLAYDRIFRQITLTVYSNLNDVGLTAAVSSRLASRGICANVVAAYFHDHLFVPSDRASEALETLKELSMVHQANAR